jgi:chemotaxis protein methyltransferase CheR
MSTSFASEVIVPADDGSVGDRELADLCDRVRREVGLHLHGKRSLLLSRIAKRARELHLATPTEYLRYLAASGESELQSFFEALCTHETRFFREAAHFDYLGDVLFPAWRERAVKHGDAAQIRIWCAACSTGEEAYSLAMTMLDRWMALGGSQSAASAIQIVATDLSRLVLDVAKDAIYPLARANELPPSYLKAFMLRGSGPRAGQMRVAPEVRSLVTFAPLNLNITPFAAGAPFDAVFCRNVLIYFDAPTRSRVAHALLERVAKGGALFLGHAEGAPGLGLDAARIAPGVYTSGTPRRRPR